MGEMVVLVSIKVAALINIASHQIVALILHAWRAKVSWTLTWAAHFILPSYTFASLTFTNASTKTLVRSPMHVKRESMLKTSVCRASSAHKQTTKTALSMRSNTNFHWPSGTNRGAWSSEGEGKRSSWKELSRGFTATCKVRTTPPSLFKNAHRFTKNVR